MPGLRSRRPTAAQQDGQLQRKAPDQRHASYYYSRPQLAVGSNVTLAGRTVAVTGRAWLDARGGRGDCCTRRARGRDWISINLLGRRRLMAFRLRDSNGTRYGRPPASPQIMAAAKSLRRRRSLSNRCATGDPATTGITYRSNGASASAGANSLLRAADGRPGTRQPPLDGRHLLGGHAIRLGRRRAEVGRGYLKDDRLRENQAGLTTVQRWDRRFTLSGPRWKLPQLPTVWRQAQLPARLDRLSALSKLAFRTSALAGRHPASPLLKRLPVAG